MPNKSLSLSKLEQVLQAIDIINAEDEKSTIFEGKEHPKELLYGHFMTDCLAQYWENPSQYLQIAVRGQHIKRWHLKRTEFASGKAGYYSWRIALGKFHAELTASLMIDAGYSAQQAEQTAVMIRKQDLKTNCDSQSLEDVACLVFLQHYFNDFAAQYTDSSEGEEKIIRIVKLTWGKMSSKAQGIALTLTLPEHLAKLVKEALK